MGKLLLITGDLAAGKSSFARQLSQRYQVAALCKDDIKEILGDIIGFADRAENKRLSVAAVELMLFAFGQAAKVQKPLILEANFRGGELRRFQQLAADDHYEILTLVLRGDMEVLHRRYVNRMENEDRNPVHLAMTLDIFEDFRAYTEALRAEPVPGKVVNIDATTFRYQQDSALLDTIDGFMIG